MGAWTAVASDRVDIEALRALLEARGISWEAVSHVTATTSLAGGIRASGVVGLPIATLTDLIVLPGLSDMALSLEGFPGPEVLGRYGSKDYERGLLEWQQSASGRRLRLGIKFDDALRQFARASELESPARLLVKSRRVFSRSVHSLIASGLRARDLSVTDDLGRTAQEAWASLEREIPDLSAPRDDLWMDFDEFQMQKSNSARDLRNRIQSALECAFGVANRRRVIVHHGFYFFTPPQWSLFQLLRRIPNVDQIFIVHDDGSNPAFETWRRFFVEKWDMPEVEMASLVAEHGQPADTPPGARALLNALSGETVASDGLHGAVTVLECRSPAELVRHWRRETVDAGGEPPRRFAADAESVERFVRRLDRDSNSDMTNLAQLPIGSFLLAIHDCIKSLADGSAEVVITDEAILDIAASGYMEVPGLANPASSYVGALRRSLPFFKGCRTGDQWRERARHLHRLIIAEVAPLGEKSASSTDLERIALAARNPFRLIPWGDLSRDEAAGISEVISSVVTLVEELASKERVELKVHMRFLRRKLEQGMQDLAEEERRTITAKVEGFSVGLEDEIDVEGLVDVVTMLLGRTVEFDALGDVEAKCGLISELRGLDALGLRKLDRDLHLTNLADGIFPSFVQPVGWPFRLEDMSRDGAEVDPVTIEILAARAENAALSDLYLLWLALNGVERDRKVTLSWISEIGGDARNLSSILALLTLPRRATEALEARAGGLKVQSVAVAGDFGALSERPVPAAASVVQSDLQRATDRLDVLAGASAVACARRLALQWVLGQSPAFQAEHHHSMLFGNIIGVLIRGHGMNPAHAIRAANDLWRQLTPGQRSSSYAKRVVGKSSSSNLLWILTLRGRWRNGNGPVDRAYQAARRGEKQSLEVIVPEESSYLPPGINDPGVCDHCPVRLSCSVWVRHSD